MSDIKDEIDWEFPGTTTTSAQSNYFWQGIIPDKTQGQTHTGLSDTYSNYHDYTIDWQPDQLTWSIDGKIVRTLKKSDTIGSDGVPHYPSTPSRVQLSIWPAGIAGTPQGTVTWAGGMINWNDADYKSAGHFYASVNKVTIKCSTASPPSGANITSYVYGGSKNQSATPSITYSNHSTLLNGTNRLVPAFGLDGLPLALFLGLLLGFNALLL
jgi:beta-glucanase (GH16 family)